MNLAARPCIASVLLGLLALSPATAHAGMTPEEVKAFEGYKVQAEKGDRVAQYNLGISYANGEGVAKDEIEAYAYWNLAGITEEMARNKLATLEKKLSRDEIAKGQQRTKELQKEIETKMAAKKAGK